MAIIKTYPDAETLARESALHFIECASEAIAEHGRFSVALAGGSTPQALYQTLATVELVPRVDWEKVHVFWGDERCVPADHRESNYALAYDSLISRIEIPRANVHRMPAEMRPLENGAHNYETLLRAFFGFPMDSDSKTEKAVDNYSPPPVFDLILLGMGADGHTAPLFPNSPALTETRRWVVPVQAPPDVDPPVPRLTLTLPVFHSARQVLFLISGSEKRAMLNRIINEPETDKTLYPAALIRPKEEPIWFIDAEAMRITADIR